MKRWSTLIGIATLLTGFFGSALLQTDAQRSTAFAPEVTIAPEVTAEPISPFELIEPSDNSVFTNVHPPSVFTWHGAQNADFYLFIITELDASGDRINIIEDLMPQALLCSNGQCSYTLTTPLENKHYEWKVVARGKGAALKASNGPRAFRLIQEKVELVANGDMEKAINHLPAKWNGVNVRTRDIDRQVCNQPERNLMVAYTGACAFMFKGNSNGSPSSLSQNVTRLGVLVNGSTLNFSAWIDRRTAAAGIPFARTVVVYSNGEKSKIVLQIPAVKGYSLVESSLPLDLSNRSVKSIRVEVFYRDHRNRFVLDHVSLIANAPTSSVSTNDWIPLPPAR